ncbi:hypothetical protein MKX01_000731 [Papaver californicum]|nr:hypothetical protein MKX01_000731 [Papaver californicum]
MGKRKIEIKKIEDRKKRNVAFTKRRNGLFKKAHDLCVRTGANISMIVISPGGKPFTFGCPDEILNRFPVNEEEEEEVNDGKRTSRSENGDVYWWNDIDMEKLNTLEKVRAVRDELLQLKDLVNKRKQDLLLALSTLPSAAAKATTSSTDNNTGDSCMSGMEGEEDEDSSWFPSITVGDNDMEEFNKLFKIFDVEQKQLPPLID